MWPQDVNPERLEYLEMFCGEIQAYLHVHHPLAKRESVTFDELASMPQILFARRNPLRYAAYLE